LARIVASAEDANVKRVSSVNTISFSAENVLEILGRLSDSQKPDEDFLICITYKPIILSINNFA
jgi:hypothetical protein